MVDPRQGGLSVSQRSAKRLLDILGSLALLAVFWPFLLGGWVAAAISSHASGVFRQVRIGRDGEPFEVMKLRTMRVGEVTETTVTRSGDARITRTGIVLRRFKIDELPQLVNVLRGEMSLVGPRPDVPGFADALEGEDRVVLSVRPGITGPASLAFRHEEELLAAVSDPEAHNRDVIWPEKVRINKEYVHSWSLARDLRYLWATLFSMTAKHKEAVQ